MDETVCAFLERHGFTQPEIKSIVLRRTDILTSNPATTLAPHILPLLQIGLSPSDVAVIIRSARRPIQYPSLVQRITFWMDFFDQNQATVTHVMNRNKGLIDNDTCVGIPLLQSQGFSLQEISKIIYEVPNFITCDEEEMRDMLVRVEEFGLRRDSEKFLEGLRVVVQFSREGLKRKMKMYGSFGWPEEEFVSAVFIYPQMLKFSKEKVGAMMDFYLKEAGLDISCLFRRPNLLGFSLKERLRPRLCVLRVLESKGLFKYRKGKKFIHAAMMKDREFVKKYVHPHEEKIPELRETFLASKSR